MISKAHRLGISRSSVIVIIICALIIVSIAAVVLRKVRHFAWEGREATYLKEIHYSWVNFANSNKGYFPIPSMLDRPPSTNKNQRSGLFGPWPIKYNTTANIYSALIAQHYFNPSILISPFEWNPVVIEDLDYNYSAYNPAKGSQWDSSFIADLVKGANVSFGHMPAIGKARLDHWRSSAGDKITLLGNRGPAEGIANIDLFSCSPDGAWRGRFVYGDGHSESFEIIRGQEITTPNSAANDNPFNYNTDAGLDFDQVIAFTQKVQDNQAILQHD